MGQHHARLPGRLGTDRMEESIRVLEGRRRNQVDREGGRIARRRILDHRRSEGRLFGLGSKRLGNPDGGWVS